MRFEVGGRQYLVERRIDAQGRTEKAVLYEVTDKGLKAIATSVRTVRSELERILGVKRDAIRVAFVAQQGELTEIIESSRRKEYVDRILGLEHISKAYEKLRTVIRLWENQLHLLVKHKERLEVELKRLEDEINELEKSKDVLAKLLEEKHSIEGRLAKVRSEIEHVKKELEQVSGSANTLKMQLENLKLLEEEYRQKLEQLEALNEYLDKLEEVKILREKLPLLRKAIDLLEKMHEVAIQANRLKKQLDEEKVLEEKAKELEKLASMIQSLEERYREFIHINEQVKSLQERLRRLRDEKEELERRIEELRRYVNERISGVLRFFRTNIEFQIDEIPERLNSLRDTIKSRLKELEGRKDELEKLKSKLRTRIEMIEEFLTKLASYTRCPLCGQQLSDKHRVSLIKKLRGERTQLMEKLQNVTNELENVGEYIERLQEMLEQVETTRNDISKVVGEYTSMLSRLKSIEEEERNIAEKLKELNIKLMEVKEDAELYLKASKAREELQEITSKLGYLRGVRQQYEQLLETIDSLYKELEKLADQIGVDAEQLLEWWREGQLNRDLIDEKERWCIEVEEKAKEYHIVREELETIKRRIEETKQLLKELEARAKKEAKLKQRLRELEALEAKLIDELRKIDAEIGRVQERLERLSKLREEVENKRIEYENVKSKIERVRRFIGDLRRVYQVLSPNGLPRVIRHLARQLIEMHVRELLTQFNIDFIDVKISEDFDITLVTRDGEKSFKMLSGGEKTALALALRIAFARALAGKGKVNTLILDEPTIHLDEVRKRELINILKRGWKGAGRITPQLIVVTHDREVEEAADQIIEVYKVSGESKVRVVTPTV